MTIKNEIKSEIKTLAQELRLQKRIFKASQRKNKSYSEQMKELQLKESKKYEFRHRHIARCLLRGRTYLEIEHKVRDYNEPSDTEVNKYLKEYCKKLGISNVPKYEYSVASSRKLNESTEKVINEMAEIKKIKDKLLSINISE